MASSNKKLNMVKEKKWIADLISPDDIRKWKPGNRILIDAQTGSGKSTFVFEQLRQHAEANEKTILFLSNRDALKEQNLEILGIDAKRKKRLADFTDGVITIANYQTLETKCKRGYVLQNYDYIICDEAHYFFSDSNFNIFTDLLEKYIFENEISVLLYMTATPNVLVHYLKSKKIKLTRKFKTLRDYSYVDQVYCYQDNDCMLAMLRDIPNDEKALIFTSAKNAIEWSGQFNNSEFYVGSSNPNHRKIKLETKHAISKESRFNGKFLFATSGLDCGVNIHDETVRHIVIDYLDLEVLVQCLGRVRAAHGQTVNVYIKNRFGEQLTRYVNQCEKIIDRHRFLAFNGSSGYLEEFNERDNEKYHIYPEKVRGKLILISNGMAYYKCEHDAALYSDLNAVYDGYIKHIVKKILKRKIDDYINLNDLYSLDADRYLESIGLDTQLFANEQEAIKKWFRQYVFKNKKYEFNVRTINGWLGDNESHFKINTGRSKKQETRDESYWMITRTEKSVECIA